MRSGGGRIVMVGGAADLAATLGIETANAPPADAALLLVPAARLAGMPPHAAPILVLDAGDAAARAALLDGGAADVVPADADPIEIAARMRAILRRGAPTRIADLAIDHQARRASRGGRAIALHPREFAVLAHLARHRERAVSRHALYEAVWQRRFDPGTNVVAVAVSRLRAKVECVAAPRLIHTVAAGYMLSAAP